MLQKFQKRSLKTDAQEGEDEEAKETMQSKKAGKRKVVTYNLRISKAGGLADAEKIQKFCSRQRKIGLLSEMAFKQLPCLEIEVEVRGDTKKNNETGPQRHDKIKRRRKRGTKIEKRSKKRKHIVNI